jgi:glycosyltransferase involved in cell wall biosynthesis
VAIVKQGPLSSFTLLFFTQSYPYDGALEQTFVQSELEYLAQSFAKVVVLPGTTDGNLYAAAPGIVYETGLAEEIRNSGRIKPLLFALSSFLLYREIVCNPRIVFNVFTIKRLVAHVGLACVTRQWVKRYLRQSRILSEQTIFYTYWLQHLTLGLGMLKADPKSRIRLISRAHGFDLYEERQSSHYQPCRKKVLALLDRLFLASEQSKKYMVGKYPKFEPMYRVAKLGTADPGFLCKPSTDGVFRLASCSSIGPLKRLLLLVEALDVLGQNRKEMRVEWYHIGDGPQRAEVEQASLRLPRNVKSVFCGHLPPENIMPFYRDVPIDLFVTLSKTEGGCPVSIKEAQSCGIPVMGTSVGGIPEIVSDENGRLLPEDPTPTEIALAIEAFMKKGEIAKEKRRRSREDWMLSSNETTLNRLFAQELQAVAAE